MKTTDSRDSQDRQLDALLASRPLPASPDFLERVMAAVDKEEQRIKHTRKARIVQFSIGMAAALAFAFSLAIFNSQPKSAPLSQNEAQDIFLLEEGLDQLPAWSANSDSDLKMLSAFEAIYFEVES